MEVEPTNFLSLLDQVMRGESTDYAECPVSAGHLGQVISQDLEAALVAGFNVNLKVWRQLEAEKLTFNVLDVSRHDFDGSRAFRVDPTDFSPTNHSAQFVLLEGPMVHNQKTMPGEFKVMRLVSFGVRLEEVD